MWIKALAASAALLAWSHGAFAETITETTGWTNPEDGTEVPALVLFDPDLARSDGTFPVMVFLHARRGLQGPDRKYLAEYAAEGFLVLAPDWQAGRFIEPWPLDHNYATERDAAMALDHVKTMKRVRAGEKLALYGYSRGGYYATRIAAGTIDPTHIEQIGCIVTIAGHFQDPNKPEPYQVYRYMPEIEQLTQPILMIIGQDDFDMRVINNARAFYALVDKGHDAELVVLPMARRAFDFRDYVEGSTQSVEEKRAKKYAKAKAVRFMKACIEGGK